MQINFFKFNIFPHVTNWKCNSFKILSETMTKVDRELNTLSFHEVQQHSKIYFLFPTKKIAPIKFLNSLKFQVDHEKSSLPFLSFQRKGTAEVASLLYYHLWTYCLCQDTVYNMSAIFCYLNYNQEKDDQIRKTSFCSRRCSPFYMARRMGISLHSTQFNYFYLDILSEIQQTQDRGFPIFQSWVNFLCSIISPAFLSGIV